MGEAQMGRSGAEGTERSQYLHTVAEGPRRGEEGRDRTPVPQIPMQEPSTEIRWFLEGPMPFIGSDLFVDEEAPPARLDTREDFYLISHDQDVGLKARSGPESQKLDLKVRTFSRLVRLGDDAGFLEGWMKWTWPDCAAPPDPLASYWVSVHKTREIWEFSYDGGNVRFCAAAEHTPGSGAIEVTRIRMNHLNFWTVAVEAFDLGNTADEVVIAAASVLTGNLRRLGVEVFAAQSVGYPAWLERQLHIDSADIPLPER